MAVPEKFLRVWDIPIGSAWITVSLAAPLSGSKHSGDRLAIQGRAIARLGDAIHKIERQFAREIEKLDPPSRVAPLVLPSGEGTP